MNKPRDGLSRQFLQGLRLSAALLTTVSGIGHIAAMWFRELDVAAVNGALFGALYLGIGIGLFGHSRLPLFLAIIVPLGGGFLIWRFIPDASITPMQYFSSSVDGLIIVLSAVVLWHVRKQPTE